MSEQHRIIIGIDPGTIFMGIGIIEIERSDMRLVSMDTLSLSPKADNYHRLQEIYNKVIKVLNLYHPDEFAIEAPFFGKNVQSMLKLGRAQGIAIAAAIQYGIPVTEYSPRKIKQSITGHGNADKTQILRMLQRMLNFSEEPSHLDATDAVAVAVCHHYQTSGIRFSTGKPNDWKDFLSKNPSRIHNKL